MELRAPPPSDGGVLYAALKATEISFAWFVGKLEHRSCSLSPWSLVSVVAKVQWEGGFRKRNHPPGSLTRRWLEHHFRIQLARAGEVVPPKSRDLVSLGSRTGRPKRRSCSGARPKPRSATASGHVLLEDKGHRRRQRLLMVSCGLATLVCVATVAVAVAVVVTATTPATTGTATSAPNTTAAPSFVAEVDRKALEVPSRRREGLKGVAGLSRRKRPEKRIGRQTTLDPRETWATFLRHSERTQTARPKKKVDPSFLRMCKNTTNCSLPLGGGANGSDSLLPWLSPLVEIDRASMLPRAQSGFFWELSEEVRARKGKELRLHPFHRPFAEGSFERGSGLNATRGMFRAPLSGLYLFFATAFATRPTCQKNLSLRTTSEFSDGEYTMSLSVNGPLMLRAGQVISLWFHNRTPYQITIHEGSQFSGFLVGL
ncbi:hypothetical protein MTO96_032063 [Rhipicephalus appendiculatus]